ncbi:MAG: NADP-dependent malic enzyme [Clostridiales bacterium]|nr:NADP-dependent malic enzyme [Clostridiales bacterium]
MDYAAKSLEQHYMWRGKLETVPKMKIDNKEAMSLAYTPGVAAPCLEIERDISKSFELTGRNNTVAVITDGSAVLGLGDIGPEAGMPVMEGKCALFKAFGEVDAVPLCIRSKDVDEIVNTVYLLSGSFGGINLEDISAPRCFEIEDKLKKICDIPIFHDDQHGTAIVVLAALLNALKVVGKKISDIKVSIAGAGAAGTAIAKLLSANGVRDIIVSDRRGLICEGDPALTGAKKDLARFTNPRRLRGGLKEAMDGSDVFIGVSGPGIVTEEMVSAMAEKSIVFAMSNPVPEIMPELAKKAGAVAIGTGRSDFPNQINNVLAFPGIFRGALDVRAKTINEEMKLAAALAIAGLVSDDLSADKLLPEPFDPRLSRTVAEAVAKAARDSGVSGILGES